MNYHFRHNITHPDGGLIEDKVNYFADFFEFSFLSWGSCHAPELENHKSLLEKIVFQLENYSEHSPKYVKHFFSNKLLTKKDSLIERFYSKEWQQINLIKNNADYKDFQKRSKAITDIKEFISKLNKTLFKNSIDTLVNIFVCKLPLEKHKHIAAIEYLTSIILAEFFYAGFTKEDLRQVFKLIFENKIILKNDKPETRIPLPPELHELKYNDSNLFFEKVSEYLKNKNLKEQFLGIYNFYKNEQKEKTFIFKIENIRTNQRIHWRYNNVTFSNNLSKRNVSKKTTRKEYAAFFSNRNVLLSEVSVIGTNDKSAKINALREVNNALLLLNSVCEANATLNPIEFILRDKDSDVLHSYFVNHICEEHKKKFNNSNIFFILKKYNNDLAIKLKEFDSIFVSGHGTLYKDTKLVNLWRYLACFFPENDIPNLVSQIIANYYSSYSKSYYIYILREIFDNYNNPKVFNKLNSEEKKEINSLMKEHYFKKVNLKRFSEITNHPYLNRELKNYLQKTTSEKIKFIKDVYEKLIFEAYEQRNLIQHSGSFHEKSVDKILISLVSGVAIIRQQLIKSVKNSKFKTFEEIVVYLLKTPRSW